MGYCNKTEKVCKKKMQNKCLNKLKVLKDNKRKRSNYKQGDFSTLSPF